MEKKKRILIDISAHGYGHIAQTAPVVNRLFGRQPLEVTIRSGAPENVLRERFDCPFEWIDRSVDFGMRMKNAVDVDVAATASNYRVFHENWKGRIEAEAKWLASASFDLILCNVPYLPLKAAKLAGIPSVAMCSLNWADLYRHYCGEGAVYEEILDAYRSAAAFLTIEPAMPMEGLDTVRVGPVAETGKRRREELRELLRLGRDEKIALVSMGGMAYSIPFEKWPLFEHVHWLVPENVSRPDMTAFGALAMPFADLLASCDVLVTKPGYGSFVEAALCGVAVLYISRGDWPEAPFLVKWLAGNARCLEVERKALEEGDIGEPLNRLLAMPEKPLPLATGIGQASDFLAALFT